VRKLDRAFDGGSWHGPNLRNSLRGVAVELAAWRPAPERHNIWELVVHAAYWKYRVCRHLAPKGFPTFDLPGSNFFSRPEPMAQTKPAWEDDVQRLERWHCSLRDATIRLTDRQLGARPTAKSEWTYEEIICGAADHDVYHAGQIRLLRRLAPRSDS